MNKYTLYHRIAAAISLALFALMIWDHFGNDGNWLVPLVILFALHILIQFLVIISMRVTNTEYIPAPVPTPAPEPAPEAEEDDGPFRYGDYTLYATKTQDKGGNSRLFYFFSKRIPRKGAPVAKPAGHHVGVNKITGLPFLKRGAGADGEVLKDVTPHVAKQCQALTAAGGQCRNSGRVDSKYCASHKGYRPPAADSVTMESDTTPRNRKAVDTVPSTRKSTSNPPS